jgi:ribosomal protein S27E
VPDPSLTSLSTGFGSVVFSRASFGLHGNNCAEPDCFANAATFVDCFCCGLLGMLGTSIGGGVAAPGLTFNFVAAGAIDT